VGNEGYADLADYRRRVSELYAEIRSSRPGEAAWSAFRREREMLFEQHTQSALDEEQRRLFRGLPYFPYDPGLRFLLKPEFDVEPRRYEISLDQDGMTTIERFARIQFRIRGESCTLSLFWIVAYGGGVFLPFRDASSGESTYGGGRYLLDTIKGADLGRQAGSWVFDFNYAYNPSCAYNARWICPLSPRENWLDMPIEAGELAYPDPR
jgi:uncharacterized protein (DUF1684 family)